MGTVIALVRIVIQRSLANWRLLLTVVLGAVISSALMASVVLYADAVRDIGLRFALRNADQTSLDLQVASTSQKSDPPQYNQRKDTTVGHIQRQAGDVLDELVLYGRSATFFLSGPGEPEPTGDLRPRAHFQFQSGLEDHVTVTAGEALAPTPPAPPGQPPTVRVWLGAAAAEQLNVAVGDTFDLHPFWREAAPVRVTVAGLLAQNDAAERFWIGDAERFIVDSTRWPTYAFFIDETTFVDTVAAYLPDMDGTFLSFGLVNIDAIDSRNAGSVEGRLNALSGLVSRDVSHTTMQTALPPTIAEYQDKLFFTRLPLFALMLLIVGIALYYLVIVATMVVERQSGEISLLKSRGAGVGQLMTVFAVEGLLIMLVAVILGPLLAAAMIRLLGPTPPFHDLSNGQLLDVHLSPEAFGLALLGSLLALAATLWPAYRSAGRSIVHFKQSASRPQQQPVFLRYYLDLGLVAVGAFAFYQLRQRGSLVTEELFGDLSADPLLLISPGLFMLMIALVFLRLFPVALRVVSWLARGARGATLQLGLWHMVRNPLHYSRLILLLILATGVGMFAASFGATLTRSYEERAAYEAGAAGRIGGIRSPANAPPAELAAAVEDLPGAGEVSVAARISANYEESRFSSRSFTLLGVDRETLPDVAFWRDDFGASSLDALMDDIATPDAFSVPEGAVIPAGTDYLGVWLNAPLTGRFARPGLRVEDAAGRLVTYRLFTEDAEAGAWQFYVTDLREPLGGGTPDLSQDLALDAVYTSMGGFPDDPQRANFIVDRVLALDGELPSDWATSGFEGTVVEAFDTLEGYEPVSGLSPESDPGALSLAADGAFDDASARLAFSYDRSTPGVIGLRRERPVEPLPIAVSASFLEATGLTTGMEITVRANGQYFPARLVSSFELFPGFYPSGREHLAVADLNALIVTGSRVPGFTDAMAANEAWLGAIPPGASVESLRAAGIDASDVFDEAALLAVQSSDPLVGASWEGILFLSFATVLVLTALGFIVFSNLAAQTRSLEFAILRTMGFSGRQILGVVAFEQCFVIVAGVATGTILGFPLGRLMIDSLGITERGDTIVPPLVTEVSWTTVLTVYGLLTLVFVASVVSLVALYSRLALHRTLRIGEL